MKINDQYSSTNVGSTSRLVFKYQGLTIKFLELFWIFINFNLEYFFTTIYELWKTLSSSMIGEPCQGIYMDFSYKNLPEHTSS
jgi:hypothetical protein